MFSKSDTRSIFSQGTEPKFVKPQGFTKVTYHGFFKCEGKCYPNTQLEIELENIIIHNILLIKYNFILYFITLL